MKTLIIGAGPAGLAVAARMRVAELDFEMIEQTNSIAWSWTQHYDRLLLHTVKELSHLPFRPFPKHYPTYVPRHDLIQYYNDYAAYFNIVPQFNTQATNIHKKENKWLVETATDTSFEVDHVIIATGVNRVPHRPQWVGQEVFQGKIIHSRDYKNVEPFKGEKVLVIGMGNTGAELALDFAENDIEVAICIRNPINILPRDVNGKPVQLTAKKLARLPFGLGDWLGTQIRKLIIGDLSKYGVPMSTVHPALQLRKTGKTPVVDLGTAKYIRNGKIKIVGDIQQFTKKGIQLKNGQQHEFDSIILATGYRPDLDDFIPNIDTTLDDNACPRAFLGTGDLKGMYFIGFDNYKLGGILGTVFNDSKVIVDSIKKKQNEK